MSSKPAATAGPIKLENTAKRDLLQSLESKYQQQWANEHVFEVDAPTRELVDMSPEELRAKYPKFFATIPYAYMNGSLHLGHAFTLSKVEFATGYERMRQACAIPVGVPLHRHADPRCGGQARA